MNDLRKAAEMALEALELYQSKMSVQMFDEAIAALRQALEKDADEWYEKALWGSQPVDAVNMTQESVDETAKGEQEPWVKTYCGGKPNYCTPETAKRKTLAELLDSTPDDAVNMSKECVDETDKGEQEPWPSVQCVCGGAIYFKYTPPVSDYHERWEEGFQAAKREWVGLTEDEKQFFKAMGFSGIDIVEAKLKEKNT